MADTIDRIRVTLHPLKDDGTMDLNTNLYPKTLLDGIVDRDGNPVDIATQEELQNATSKLSGDITENIEIINQTIQETTQHLEQEINAIPKGDVTTEQLNEALADKVTQEDLNTSLESIHSELDTKASQEDLDDLEDALDNKLVEYYLRFYWDSDNNKIVLDSSSVKDWMESPESFEDRLMLISVNGSISAICRVNKHISSNLIQIYIDCEDFGTIYMYCNIKDGDWNINLDGYFPPIYDGSEFAPYLEISNGEVVDDNVIKPHWITSFDDRVDVLSYAPAKAWVGIEDALEPCTIYRKFFYRKFSEDKYNIIICIQTSKGEYQLTYQFESYPL